MVRKKGSQQGKGKGVASSSRQEIEEEIVEEMEEDSDEESAPLESRTGKREKRRKRRTAEEMAADAKLDWVESIPGRGFKSERQISRRGFGNDSDIIIQLGNQGLLFWTKSLRGYNEKGVIEFYQKLDTSEALTKEKIKSKVNGKTIEVGVAEIAKYLKYERPAGDLINYPRAESIDSDVIPGTYLDQNEKLIKYSDLSTRSLFCFQWQIFIGQYLDYLDYKKLVHANDTDRSSQQNRGNWDRMELLYSKL
ncbi:hypothetical protein RHGRI_008611 [Rhododendron griersonianum]|uniref:Uncharacterized protein n=1 Tax=Rhododendron griersonianum TaxID=479676 RepID=A0AAV6L227_9ERIC|nr:hypothetical protein RHGRI_031065 [Rhododendron griersonianum]KAG5545768.1 hypothetical protein RHGRI_018054 [Rhododendron griersonianum]KAG5554047.1 hypothetical protein RHGRI_011797 [Rhododendron griersonianum]KAG5558706.1 hypothetical protein RHGRI_008611 [Rhododendron griersonianum]